MHHDINKYQLRLDVQRFLWPVYYIGLFILYLYYVGPLSCILGIMAYGSTPYVGMTPKKNGGHIKSAQMTRSKCLHRSVNGLHEPYQALSSTSMGNRTINLLESIAKVPDRQSLKRAKSSTDFFLSSTAIARQRLKL